VLGSVSLASGDPITFTYRIDLVDCGFCPPRLDPPPFLLTLSFEADPIASVDEFNLVRHDYGLPSFSEVPLFRPAVPSGLPDSGRVVDVFGRSPGDLTALRFAEASNRQLLGGADTREEWETRLSIVKQPRNFGNPPPTLTPAGLGAFLGENGDFIFSYKKTVRGNDGPRTTESIFYLGRASLLSDVGGPAPTPEPATWVLLITGLGLCAVWGRRLLP